MDSAFDEDVCNTLNSALDDIKFIMRHMESNKEGPGFNAFEKELHEATVKLHEAREDVYAVQMMLGKPAYMEKPLAHVKIKPGLSQKVDELTHCLTILCDQNASPESRKDSLLMIMNLCVEMSHIAPQHIQNDVVPQPDLNFKPDNRNRDRLSKHPQRSRPETEQIREVDHTTLV